MTTKELLEKLKDIPERIDNAIEMKEINSPIQIYEGDFKLHFGDKIIQINGKINFYWYPKLGAYFEGNPNIEPIELIELNIKDITIFINDFEFGKGFITKTVYGSSKTNSILKGTFTKQVILGDKSIPVEKIKFSIPNLRNFHGQMYKVIKDVNIKTNLGRLILENNDYLVVLDKRVNYMELNESLNERGGYVILYDGEISGKKKALTVENTHDIIQCLGTFLSFLNGRRTSPFFLQGIHEKEVKWCIYTNYLVDDYKTVNTWPQRNSVNGINDIWIKFCSLWKDRDNRNFLTFFTHWYVESNGHSGFTEGSIIMAQTALELVYNWWIVEEKDMITGKDSENISASNKIRLLLSQLGIDDSVPPQYDELIKFINENPEIKGAPEAVVQIRNAIIHSQGEKRRKLSNIHFLAKYQALQMYIWYMELSLLRILDFHGLYFNRCSKEKYVVNSEEKVPWNK